MDKLKGKDGRDDDQCPFPGLYAGLPILERTIQPLQAGALEETYLEDDRCSSEFARCVDDINMSASEAASGCHIRIDRLLHTEKRKHQSARAAVTACRDPPLEPVIPA